ncbi:nuclear transport factor 2 family protein [Curvibacter sp. CHRR-16]|uniref:nuclear transport factor 2 family protein n=1 Tax=Curvibacter sp. CHRR-16 TaxID=2835872 RepID=UPI001BD9B870|nr:nuclear transport factor 2 family protein [Curvibacter sp. CHRR-16]MBT0569341.1 nuclear transport factor 2 family protein [Curvibacter sp. CHRR-16]
MNSTTPLERITRYFETLQPQSLELLESIYHPQAQFKDPFQQVQGLAAIARIYQHMFSALVQPRFVIQHRLGDAQQCFLTWDFHFAVQRGARRWDVVIHGSSHLLLDDLGRITQHRDYWDVAEELYEKLPVLGSLMRWLKQKGQTPQ